VTLQPLRLGMDAAILFADILLPLEPMGAPFEFAKGEGPVIHSPVRDRAPRSRSCGCSSPKRGSARARGRSACSARSSTARRRSSASPARRSPIASYLVEGGKSSDYRITKNMMWSEPETVERCS
jgi:uroporphyrinogen decarboxylase